MTLITYLDHIVLLRSLQRCEPRTKPAQVVEKFSGNNDEPDIAFVAQEADEIKADDNLVFVRWYMPRLSTSWSLQLSMRNWRQKFCHLGSHETVWNRWQNLAMTTYLGVQHNLAILCCLFLKPSPYVQLVVFMCDFWVLRDCSKWRPLTPKLDRLSSPHGEWELMSMRHGLWIRTGIIQNFCNLPRLI